MLHRLCCGCFKCIPCLICCSNSIATIADDDEDDTVPIASLAAQAASQLTKSWERGKVSDPDVDKVWSGMASIRKDIRSTLIRAQLELPAIRYGFNGLCVSGFAF